MKTHKTTRIVNNQRYRCLDTGCADFDRAEYNRYIIANELFTTFYQTVENYLTHTPQRQALPLWIPQGELPSVGKKDWQQYGEQAGGGLDSRFCVNKTE